MISLTTAFLIVTGLITVVWIGTRDHAQLRATRRSILDASASLLDGAKITHGGDDFPSLSGHRDGIRIHAALVPDTMTIRRLPQLWLSLTRFEDRPALAEFAILVRPAGTEFYSLTGQYRHRLNAPAGLPDEVLICGSRPDAQRLLDRTSSIVVKILRDPKVKELAVTSKGLRLVWQASEGRRGEHLLLRQSVFDDASIAAADFQYLLDEMDALSRAIGRLPEQMAS